mmetsp:Transcript_47705/g.97487  ORF Transcript_47705/g.97487 Transcript_47705/m.97487 type:complete len:84 (-) Transcript_47705:87-338(-)
MGMGMGMGGMLTSAATRGPLIIMMNGRPYMLQECSGSDVYCNALEGFEPLSEGANGPAAWKTPVEVDPNSVDPWLSNVGGGIY